MCLHEGGAQIEAVLSLREERIVWSTVQGGSDWHQASLGSGCWMYRYGSLRHVSKVTGCTYWCCSIWRTGTQLLVFTLPVTGNMGGSEEGHLASWTPLQHYKSLSYFDVINPFNIYYKRKNCKCFLPHSPLDPVSQGSCLLLDKQVWRDSPSCAHSMQSELARGRQRHRKPRPHHFN